MSYLKNSLFSNRWVKTMKFMGQNLLKSGCTQWTMRTSADNTRNAPYTHPLERRNSRFSGMKANKGLFSRRLKRILTLSCATLEWILEYISGWEGLDPPKKKDFSHCPPKEFTRGDFFFFFCVDALVWRGTPHCGLECLVLELMVR